MKETNNLEKEKETLQHELERYIKENEDLRSLVIFRDFENACLRKDIHQFKQWMNKLQKSFSAIMVSRRWKLGSLIVGLPSRMFFKQKNHPGAEKITEVFCRFQALKQEIYNNKVKKVKYEHNDFPFSLEKDIKLLKNCLDELSKMVELLLNLKRWKYFNLIGKAIMYPLGRGKIPNQVVKIQELISDYQSWSNNNEIKDLKKMKLLLDEFDRNYTSFINSRRCKLGDKAFSFVNFILFRKQDKLVTDKIDTILVRYRDWKKKSFYLF